MNTLPAEVEKRNLISVINSCLQEHVVTISDGATTGKLALVQVKAKSPPARDFAATFPEVNGFSQTLTARVLGDESRPETYGVLVNADMVVVYAFNMRFGALDRDRHKIKFCDPRVYLRKLVDEKKREAEAPQNEHIVTVPLDWPEGDAPREHEDAQVATTGIVDVIDTDMALGDMEMKYAFVGAKPQLGSTPSTSMPAFERPSLLPHIKEAYAEKRVVLMVNGEPQTFTLIDTNYITDTRADFQTTYAPELAYAPPSVKSAVAVKFMKGMNKYTLILDENWRVAGAFNQRFARYDPDRQAVLYQTFEDALARKTPTPSESDDADEDVKRLTDIARTTPHVQVAAPEVVHMLGFRTAPIVRRRGGADMAMRYALVAKNDE